jgi:acetyltransferase
MGIQAALVITAGFGEVDDEGKEIEAELVSTIEEHDIRLCGSNSIGYANTHDEAVISITCSRQPRPGSIGLISHSGALAFTTFFERGEDEGAGFSYIVSTGNEVDQTLTDYIEYMGASDRVDVITAYIEGLDDPRRFMQVADEVTRQGTPVLVIKVGRTAQTLPQCHTRVL